jgi:GH15 family glucan-1,4-alpha-glucosidase
MNLQDISIEVIKQNQHPSGAYVACPNFSNYRYSWLRDGTFIAYSMDRVGEFESAEKFYRWVHQVIVRHHGKLERLLEKYHRGDELNRKDFLPCRYTLEGNEVNDDWPTFQLDGYGTWLWGFSEHIRRTNRTELLDQFKSSIEDTITYLKTFWRFPNSDCWEENEDKIHPSTLACICGGLKAINSFLHREEIESVINEIIDYLENHAVLKNRFVKYVGSQSVDASLLWLSVPFNVFPVDHPYMTNTVQLMEETVLHKGGVHRFPEDTYYGGGEWLLLSGWLGWYYASVGRDDDAKKQLEWVESKADESGLMTEQSLEHVNDPSYIQIWMDKWGPVAKPLLWSHAMYLVLHQELSERNIILKMQ